MCIRDSRYTVRKATQGLANYILKENAQEKGIAIAYDLSLIHICILWLPDVFGYSGALPQIMKKSGIKYFMTTKLAWNQINKVPYAVSYTHL